MSGTDYENIAHSLSSLKINLTDEEFADFTIRSCFTAQETEAIAKTFDYLAKRKEETTVSMMLRLSHLPLKYPKTFDNFRFNEVKGKNIDRLDSLRSLAALHAHKNVAFIGPAGTGKTHLAMAFGYECCMKKYKTYFIKMSELNDLFTTARKYGKTGTAISSLVKPSCLIIDEVGHCVFDRENTRLFFDLIDRRYNKEGSYNMVFTSNKQPATWKFNFNEDDSLLCALDRIFDDALIFNFKGESHRGKKCETVALTTVRDNTNGSTEKPVI